MPCTIVRLLRTYHDFERGSSRGQDSADDDNAHLLALWGEGEGEGVLCVKVGRKERKGRVGRRRGRKKDDGKKK